MEFREIFFLFVVPLLAAILTGLAVNFLARMRAATSRKEMLKEFEQLKVEKESLENQLEESRNLAETRGRLLSSKQEEYLAPLVELRESLGLEFTIGFDKTESSLSRAEIKQINSILEEVRQLREAQLKIMSEMLLNLGLILCAAGRLEEAIRIFQEAVESEAIAKDVRANLGMICLRLRKYEEAEQEFSTLVELAPHRFDAHFGLGLSLIELEKPEESVTALSTAIRLRPENARTYCELGKAYMLSGELERAMESAQVALKLNPGLYEGNILLQQLLIKQGRFEEAIKACRSYIGGKKDAIANYNLASAHALKGDKELALKALRDAISLADRLRFQAKDDPSFNNIKESPRFRELMEGRVGLF